jgi:ABC-2 type transport system ATP-binding protein
VTAGVIRVEGVCRRYAQLQALDDVTFGVGAGAVTGLLGPNGAGKTTLIRVLSAILDPDAGAFWIDGVPHTRPHLIRGLVGVLPESTGYPMTQTGVEYLREYARLYGLSRPDARAVAERLLAQLGLEDRARATISTYSRGMRQRLGIARALVNEPRVLFLDEPTLGLDPAGQRQVLADLSEIAGRTGAAVLLSTHQLAEVEDVCTDVLILDRGRVAAQGTVAEVVQLAAAPRTARVRVGADDVVRARAALDRVDGIGRAEVVSGPPGLLRVTLEGRPGDTTAANDGLRALLDADLSVVEFELERARLSDAFLELTGSP